MTMALPTLSFSSFVDKVSHQRGHRHRGASFEVRRPSGATSRQCHIICIVPLAGHAPAEPLERGHEWIVSGTLPFQ